VHTRYSILLVEDNKEAVLLLQRVLRSEDLSLHLAGTVAEARGLLEQDPPDLALVDLNLPDGSGLELLADLRESYPEVPVIVMTGNKDLSLAASAMRLGAVNYFTKPIDFDAFKGVLRQWLPERQARGIEPEEDDGVSDDPHPSRSGEDEDRYRMVGHHPSLLRTFKQIGMAASTQDTVLVRGETGTGKELVARAIHHHRDPDQPFVAVNCAALPTPLLESELFGHVRGAFTGAVGERKGRFEMAGTGTLFLDEIGETSIDFQASLLRILQEREFTPLGSGQLRPFKARVVAATHRDLEGMLEEGTFRRDLYYRIRVVEIEVPPLRDRISDLSELARYFVDRAARDTGRTPPELPDETLEALASWSWPGNVRELENLLRRAVALNRSRRLGREALGDFAGDHPGHGSLSAHGAYGARGARGGEDAQGAEAGSEPPSPDAQERPDNLEALTSIHAREILAECEGNKREAARRLGISPGRLYRMLDETDA
jgi:DNA-binding NtrC family response regulator